MSLGRIPVQKISAARTVAGRACDEAFDKPSDQRVCHLGNELMVTALASQQEIELGKIPKGWRESKTSGITCAKGSIRTKKVGSKIRLLVCCPAGPGHYKRGRCRVGMRVKATLKKG